MTRDNEVKLGNNVYTFETAGIAAAFLACMASDTLDHCKINFPPASVITVPEVPQSGE